MPEGTVLCVLCAARTDPGCDPDKQVNEDAYGICPVGGSLLAILCDGMGGHFGGQLASSTAVDTIQKTVLTHQADRATRELLNHAIVSASAAVHQIGGTAPAHERPGATCVAAWLHADSLLVAHVGDSRCYLWRAGNLRAVTRDHSVIEAWIQAGQVTREQAHLHPDAHRITRALGIESKVEVELSMSLRPELGDRLLLCSDGLTDLVTESEVADFLSRPDPIGSLADELVALAKLRGGHDNVTVVILEVASESSIAPDPNDMLALSWHRLTAQSKAGTSTEQIAVVVPFGAGATLGNAATDRTILMEDGLQPALGAGSPAERHLAKTQPLMQARLTTADTTTQTATRRQFSASVPPQATRQGSAQGSKRLWTILGLCLLLIGLAALKRLFRH